MNPKFQEGQTVLIMPKQWFIETYLKSYQLTDKERNSEKLLSKIMHSRYPHGWHSYMWEMLGTPAKIISIYSSKEIRIVHGRYPTLYWLFSKKDLTTSLDRFIQYARKDVE